eukprot:5587952-Pleurochrysis_carterae.AAC.1
MSKKPGGEEAGVSRWQQRKAAKAMMYAMSTEQDAGSAIAARRQLATGERYAPRTGGEWQGKAWGLGSTKVGGRQAASATRYSAAGSRRGELYYGQKRTFNTDLPPEDPKSFLSRGGPQKAQTEAVLDQARQLKARLMREKRKRKSSSSSSSSSSSD